MEWKQCEVLRPVHLHHGVNKVYNQLPVDVMLLSVVDGQLH